MVRLIYDLHIIVALVAFDDNLLFCASFLGRLFPLLLFLGLQLLDQSEGLLVFLLLGLDFWLLFGGP